MAYAIRPSDGIRFALPGYPNCVIAALDTGGVGQIVILGSAPVGSLEYDALAILWGPGDMTGLSMTEGPFLNNVIIPAANAAIASLTGPQTGPAIQGGAPVTIQNTNNGLWQYFHLVNGQLVFKSYP